jgi:hypothetical protein
LFSWCTIRTEAFSTLVALSLSTLRIPSTKPTKRLRGMKYSCRMSVSSGSALRRYGTESCIGSLRLTRHASPDLIACARVTVQVSIRCSMCFSENHFASCHSPPRFERLIVNRRSLVALGSPSGARCAPASSVFV